MPPESLFWPQRLSAYTPPLRQAATKKHSLEAISEVISESAERSPESIEYAKNIEKSKHLGESKSGQIDVRVDEFQERVGKHSYDTETPAEIRAMELDKPLDTVEKVQRFERFKISLASLLACAHEWWGIKFEDLQTPAAFLQQIKPYESKLSSSNHREAIRKISEAVQNPQAESSPDSIRSDILQNWTSFISSSAAKYREVKQFQADPPPAVKRHPILSTIGLVAGGVVAVKVFKWIFGSDSDKKESPEKGGFFKGLAKWGGIFGSLFLLGAILKDPGKIQNWLSDKVGKLFGLDFLKDIADKIKNNPFSKLLEGLLGKDIENHPKKEMYEKARIEIKKEINADIDLGTLISVGENTYDEFMEEGFLESQYIKVRDSLLKQIPWYGEKVAKSRNQLKNLKKYFNLKQKEIQYLKSHSKVNSSTTIESLLELLVTPKEAHLAASNPQEQADYAARQAAIERLPTHEKSIVTEFETEIQKWLTDKEITHELDRIDNNSSEVSTQPARQLLAARVQARQKYQNILTSPHDTSTLQDAIAEVVESDLALSAELQSIRDEINVLPEGNTLWKLGIFQGPRFLRRWITAPKTSREYVKFLFKEHFIEKPIKAAAKVRERIQAPEVRADQKIRSAKDSISDIDSKIADKKTKLSQAFAEAERIELRDEIAALEKEKSFHQTLENIAAKEKQLAVKKGSLRSATPSMRQSIERDIKQIEGEISSLNLKKIEFEGQMVLKNAHDIRLKLESRFQKGLTPDYLRRTDYGRFENLGKQFNEYRRSLEKMVHERSTLLTTELEKMEKNLPHDKNLIKRLQDELNDLFAKQVNVDKNVFVGIDGHLQNAWERLKAWKRGEVITDIEYKGELDKLHNIVRNIYKKQKTDPTLSMGGELTKKLSKSGILSLKGRGLIYLLQIGIGTGFNYQNEEGKPKVGIGKAAGQAAIDMLPVTSTLSDFYAAALGREYLTGQTISGKDQWIRLAFGAAGLACDITSLIGVGLLGRTALTSFRAGRVIAKGRRLAHTAEIIKDARKTSKEIIQGSRTLSKMTEAGQLGRKIIIGSTLASAAISLTFTPETVPISEGTKKIMGDDIAEIGTTAI